MIEEDTIRALLSYALQNGADFAELFFEDDQESTVVVQHHRVENDIACVISGVGIRLMHGQRSSNSYTGDISQDGILQAIKDALDGLESDESFGLSCSFCILDHTLPERNTLYHDVPKKEDILQLLKEAESFAYGCNSGVRDIQLAYYDHRASIAVINSEGIWATEKRVRSRVRFNVTMTAGTKISVEGKDFYLTNGVPASFDPRELQNDIRAFIQSMVISTQADHHISGTMTVVFEAGDNTLFHEACGHPFEGNCVVSDQSVFSRLQGKKIASDKVTWIDDGSIAGLYGTNQIDDEGHPTQKNILIANGILTGYLHDRISAHKMKTQTNGCARRQSFKTPPVARMSNTYIDKGTDDPEEMITSLKFGLFVKRIGGGSVNSMTGFFNVEVKEGYLIENGVLGKPVSGITISGSSADTLRNIDRVGNLLPVPFYTGIYCGGGSGFIPVTFFSPCVLVKNMVIGGVSV